MLLILYEDLLHLVNLNIFLKIKIPKNYFEPNDFQLIISKITDNYQCILSILNQKFEKYLKALKCLF